MEVSFIDWRVWGYTGSSMWVNGGRGVALCYVNTIGTLPHGIWLVLAISIKCQPKEPLESILHCPKLLSPESMGLKLKPIKTRISLEV